MFKKIAKGAALFVSLSTVLVMIVWAAFNWPVKIPDKDFKFGVTFSHRYATDIGLDWREAYLEMLDDLNVRRIRIPVYWDLVEKEDGQYDFSDVDWQLDEARGRNAEIILVVGQKVPRWPECFVPGWIGDDDALRGEKLLRMIETTVSRYKDGHPEIKYWQVENEPFLDFGICPKLDVDLLDKEIDLVRKIDDSRSVIVTDSGELSIWLRAAKRADVFGTTMYRTVYTDKYGYFEYPIGPSFFRLKGWYTKKFTDKDDVMVIELQGEPWLPGWTTGFPKERQLQSMSPAILMDNIDFAKKTGFGNIYIWGVEWWYWMKKEQNFPDLWETASVLFEGDQLFSEND